MKRTPMRRKPPKPSVTPETREFVLRRDGGCRLAHLGGCRGALVIHHIVRRSQLGSHEPENLLTVCQQHHDVSIHNNVAWAKQMGYLG